MKKVTKEMRERYRFRKQTGGKYQYQVYEEDDWMYVIHHKWKLKAKIYAILFLPFWLIVYVAQGIVNGLGDMVSDISRPFNDKRVSASFTVMYKDSKIYKYLNSNPCSCDIEHLQHCQDFLQELDNDEPNIMYLTDSCPSGFGLNDYDGLCYEEPHDDYTYERVLGMCIRCWEKALTIK